MYTITNDIDVRDMARGAVLLGSGGGDGGRSPGAHGMK